MKGQLTQPFIYCLTSLVSGWAIAVSPVHAATLASSEAQVKITNYSHQPLDILPFTLTNTFTNATQGQVTANADAHAEFIQPENSLPNSFNSSWSRTSGQGKDYLGVAESTAGIILYNFEVGANEDFSFDFNTLLNLKTAIDDPTFEQASATGNILYQLYEHENGNILDFFTVSGHLNTLGFGEGIDIQNSQNFQWGFKEPLDTKFGGQSEVVNASLVGHYSQHFDNLTYLTLVEVKSNQASVKAPEPSPAFALICFCLIGSLYKLKKISFKA